MPQQVLPDKFARQYLSKNVDNRTFMEQLYAEHSALREEQFGNLVPSSNQLLGPRLTQDIKNIELANTIYIAEQYRGLRYDDGLGNSTVGIGWNIDPNKNIERNEATIQFINGQGGRQYTLEGLQEGREILQPEDAVKIMNFHIGLSRDEASKLFNMSKVNRTQQSILTDMSFQLGSTSLSKFTQLIKTLNPMEILRSTAFTTQTPMRFAKHFVKWVNSDTSLSSQQKLDLKENAIKFTRNKKVKNISNRNKVSEVLKILGGISATSN